MRIELRISGYGGQGIIRAGRTLAMAGSLYEGKYAVMTQSYGPETRGGSCRSDVVISDQVIDYPMVNRPDILVAISQDGYNLNIDKVREGGTVIIDSDLVQDVRDREDVTHYSASALKLAVELSNRITQNVVMLGILSGITGIVKPRSLLKVIEASFPEGTIEINTRALKEGYKLGLKMKSEVSSLISPDY